MSINIQAPKKSVSFEEISLKENQKDDQIFSQIITLYQPSMCAMIKPRTSSLKQKKEDIPDTIIEMDEECPICLEEYDETLITILAECEHTFHSKCISSWETLNLGQSFECPVCRTPQHKIQNETLAIDEMRTIVYPSVLSRIIITVLFIVLTMILYLVLVKK